LSNGTRPNGAGLTSASAEIPNAQMQKKPCFKPQSQPLANPNRVPATQVKTLRLFGQILPKTSHVRKRGRPSIDVVSMAATTGIAKLLRMLAKRLQNAWL